jgi:hypothetical protein
MKAIHKIEEDGNRDNDDDQTQAGHLSEILHSHILKYVRDILATVGSTFQ